jgi:membrane-associated protein
VWFVTASLLVGAFLGDACSYFIGRAIGISIFHDRKRILNFKNYRKVEVLLEKYGVSAIFFARFIGPFSKLAPVLAGVFKIPPRTFFLYNIPGIIIAVGQAVIIGYFFGNQYELVFLILEKYFLLVLLVVLIALLVHWYFRKKRKSSEQNFFPEEEESSLEPENETHRDAISMK